MVAFCIEFIDDGTSSGTDELGMELKRFADQELANSIKNAHAQAARRNQAQKRDAIDPHVIFFMIDDMGKSTVK